MADGRVYPTRDLSPQVDIIALRRYKTAMHEGIRSMKDRAKNLKAIGNRAEAGVIRKSITDLNHLLDAISKRDADAITVGPKK